MSVISERTENRLTITAKLRCPVSRARCLAVTAASWVRDAVGEGAFILWPNRVILGEKPICAITCRATADDEIMLTFEPEAGALPIALDVFEERVTAAAAAAVEGYPENQPALLQAYCEHCRTVMKFVNVTYRGMPLYGFAFAVDKHGGLMVMTQESHTVVTVYGGEAEIVKKGEEPDTAPDLPNMPGRYTNP